MAALVIIPTYNERENLPVVVDKLLRVADVRVLVVDDGSPDGTGGVAEELAHATHGTVSVLHRTGARGLGRSYVEGLTHALRTDATVVCQMDADLSHDPADVPRLVERSAAADLVIGSRYVQGGHIVNWPARRVALSAFANRYVRVVTGLRIRDCTSGFRCWRRQALENLPLDRIASNHYAFRVELTWEAVHAGCRIAEVPITFVERRQGASKVSPAVLLESAVLPWKLALRGARR
jgi:dolichol-phosphate mannosyltransferase